VDVILALGAEVRKMFAGDAVLSLATVVLVAALGLLVRSGALGEDAARWLLVVGVGVVLVTSIFVGTSKMIRKSGK
jgi:hypothetical protein